jgi:regulator of sigma E protease
MEFASLLTVPIWTFVTYVIPFLLLLTVIVFIHELGHFKVARWCGVGIDTFAVGFGRELFGWTDKHGTRWKLGWIPLGGYVKFQDDANAASLSGGEGVDEERGLDPSKSFHGKPVAQRAAVVAAGPIANFLLAILIFALTYTLVGVPIAQPIVDEVKPGSAAEIAGILPDDKIVAIDGVEMKSFSDMQRLVSESAGIELTLYVLRNGAELQLKATPQTAEIDDGAGGKMRLGLLGITRNVSKDLYYDKKGPVEAVGLAVGETWYIVRRSLSYVKNMIVGKESTDQLAGPIRIAQISGVAASVSVNALVQLGALLSVSIGLINLFPIPMLDGGHLLYYLVEAVRGKPLGQRAQEMGFKVGFALVMMLMVVATWNDIVRLISS